MGTGMADRLLGGGHTVVGYDVSPDSVAAVVGRGAAGASSLEALVASLAAPRAVWVMVPHGEPTRRTIEQLLSLLAAGDLLVDGGNSHYTDSVAHAARCSAQGVSFLDVGVSGGVWGAAEGFNIMAGGPREAFDRLLPIFATLAPPDGYAHVGPSGAGHFVKMIHNAIEYAMLQALGEGFECLQRSDFGIDLPKVAQLWQHGSVVRSWLLMLLGRALEEHGGNLAEIGDRIEDSGTGRWTIEYAVERGIPLPAISTAVFERFDSQIQTRFAHQVIAALRQQFGGHRVDRA